MVNHKGDPMQVEGMSTRKRKSDVAEGIGDPKQAPKVKDKRPEKEKEKDKQSASTSKGKGVKSRAGSASASCEEISPVALSILSESQESASRATIAIKRALATLEKDSRIARATVNAVAEELEMAITETWAMAIELEAHKAIVKDRASLTRAIIQAPSNAPPRALWSDVTRREAQPTRVSEWPPVPPKTVARPGVMFYPTKEGQESTATKEAVMKTIVPETLGVHITGVRKIRGGGIIVHPKSDDEAKRLMAAPGLTEAGLKAQVAGRKLPRVIIFNVPIETTEEQLKEAIINNTQEASGLASEGYAGTKLSHKAGPKTERCHMIMSIPGKAREALLNDGRLFMGWNSFPVRDFCGVVKCAKCHLYGHMAKGCNAKVTTCGHCTREGHDRADCPTADEPGKCPACTRYKKPNGHLATDPDCPARLHAIEEERSRTDYCPQ